MTFRLGKASRAELQGVDPGLVRVVERAIELTTVDFGVSEGLRSLSRQRELYEAGASRTLDSYHLPDANGVGWAVDLYAWIAGKPQWQSAPMHAIAVAMRQAGIEQSYSLVWGAVWDRKLEQLDPANLAGEIDAYRKRYQLRNGAKKRPLIDRPHFQGQRLADHLPQAA